MEEKRRHEVRRFHYRSYYIPFSFSPQSDSTAAYHWLYPLVTFTCVRFLLLPPQNMWFHLINIGFIAKIASKSDSMSIFVAADGRRTILVKVIFQSSRSYTFRHKLYENICCFAFENLFTLQTLPASAFNPAMPSSCLIAYQFMISLGRW